MSEEEDENDYSGDEIEVDNYDDEDENDKVSQSESESESVEKEDDIPLYLRLKNHTAEQTAANSSSNKQKSLKLFHLFITYVLVCFKVFIKLKRYTQNKVRGKRRRSNNERRAHNWSKT
jgi:hypothetical protein